MAADIDSMTLRLPKKLFEASRSLARKRGISLNSLVQEELGAAIRTARQQRIYDSFNTLAESPDEDTDVEWMIPLMEEAWEQSDAAAEKG
jgi:hypothetical protein